MYCIYNLRISLILCVYIYTVYIYTVYIYTYILYIYIHILYIYIHIYCIYICRRKFVQNYIASVYNLFMYIIYHM